MVHLPCPCRARALEAVSAKNQSNDFPEHYLHFGWSKVIILGAARQGKTLGHNE
jgi:hypothetical protein